MSKDEAIKLACDFLLQEMGCVPKYINAKKSSYDDNIWGVVFDLSHPGVIVDGPIVVLIDSNTKEASFL